MSRVVGGTGLRDKPKAKPCLNKSDMENLRIKVGQTLQFEIRMTGEPPPDVIWTANGQTATNAGRVQICTEPMRTILSIQNAQRNDCGNYALKAKNFLGVDSASATVTVIGKPSCPTGPLGVTIISRGSCSLNWQPPEDDGGEPIEEYVIEALNASERVNFMTVGRVTANLCTFEVKGLKERKEYVFRVKVRNKEGESEYLQTDKITMKDPFEIERSKLKPTEGLQKSRSAMNLQQCDDYLQSQIGSLRKTQNQLIASDANKENVGLSPFEIKLKPTAAKPRNSEESEFLSAILAPKLRRAPSPDPRVINVPDPEPAVRERCQTWTNLATEAILEDEDVTGDARDHLMTEIRMGIKLRPTVTNDRSAAVRPRSEDEDDDLPENRTPTALPTKFRKTQKEGDDSLQPPSAMTRYASDTSLNSKRDGTPHEKLLNEIRAGLKLKPTVTKDRSAAVLPRSEEDENEDDAAQKQENALEPTGFKRPYLKTLKAINSNLMRSTSENNLASSSSQGAAFDIEKFKDEVRSGIKLRKTVTDDRSAPVLKAIDENKVAAEQSSEPANDRERILREIRGGVKLRSVTTADRSAPVVKAEIEDEKTSTNQPVDSSQNKFPALPPPPPPALPPFGDLSQAGQRSAFPVLPPPPLPPPGDLSQRNAFRCEKCIARENNTHAQSMDRGDFQEMMRDAEWQAYAKISILLDRPTHQIHDELKRALKSEAPPFDILKEWILNFKQGQRKQSNAEPERKMSKHAKPKIL